MQEQPFGNGTLKIDKNIVTYHQGGSTYHVHSVLITQFMGDDRANTVELGFKKPVDARMQAPAYISDISFSSKHKSSAYGPVVLYMVAKPVVDGTSLKWSSSSTMGKLGAIKFRDGTVMTHDRATALDRRPAAQPEQRLAK